MSDKFIQKRKQQIQNSVKEALEELQKTPGRPQNMAYFEGIIKDFYEAAPKDSIKIVGTCCVQVPEELIYAAGALPVKLCAASQEAAAVGDEMLPQGACPMVKSILGFAKGQLSPVYAACETVVIPTTCDWKKKLGEYLGDYMQVWPLQVPHIKESEASRKHWYAEIIDLKKKLEELTGNKITREKLLAAIKTVQRTQAEFRRLHQFRMLKPSVISGRDALLIMQSYSYAETAEWGKNLNSINYDLKQREIHHMHCCDSKRPRILLTGSPILFPNWKVPDLIESSGAIIAADEFCSSSRYIYDMAVVDELDDMELLKSVADRYLLPCTCPCFTPNTDRMEKVLQLVDDFQIDGVIYHVLKGCHPYDFELYRFEKKFQEAGIPYLKVETDYSSEDVEQLRTRIEAFLENLRRGKGDN